MKTRTPGPMGKLAGLSLIMGVLTFNTYTYASLPADWQTWNSKQLLDATGTEAWKTLTVNEQQDVANHTWTTYLHDGGTSASIGLADFLRIADRFQDRLDAIRRDSLASAFESRISSRNELASLGVWDVWRMRRVASSLGIANVTMDAWTQSYLQTSNQIFVDAGKPELGLIMGWLDSVEHGLGVDMSQTRNAVASYVESLETQVPDGGTVALYAELRRLGSTVTDSSEQTRRDIARELTGLVQSNHKAFLGLTVWNMDYFRKTAEAAGVSRAQITDWTLAWFLQNDAWKEKATYREINALYDWVFEARTHADGRVAERRLVDYLRARLVLDPDAVAMPESDGGGLARVLRSVAPRMDEDELEVVARHVIDRLTRDDGIDGDHWHYENVASLFGTDSLRQELRAAMVDAEGNPRAKVGKVVTWMYRGSPEAAAWRDELEAKGTDNQTAAGQRARWLLLRADAASPITLSVDDPTDTKTPREWAQDALAVAPDEPTRLACLRWIIADDLLFKRVSQAEATLTLEASAITSPNLIPAVDDLKRRVAITKDRQQP
ncbi:MAG: hypothetical protein R3C45_12470 [Phycisphaerales bacterium]